jgi:hypothetical protein
MPKYSELEPGEFGKVAHLFAGDLPNRTMVFSTIDGFTPGRVLVDDAAKPSCCLLVTSYYQWSLVGGEPENRWLGERMRELLARDSMYLTAYDKYIPAPAPPLAPERVIERLGFSDRADDGLPIELPEGFALHPIDREIFPRCQWRDIVTTTFGGEENFYRKGVGLAIVTNHGRDPEIASEAYAVFRGDGMFELGIVTNESYRRRNLAYLVCKALARQVEKMGYLTYWSCNVDNLGSVGTARKLGFRNEQRSQLYFYAKGTS